MRNPQEAYAYLTALKQILSYLGICDCNMEEGSLRCDANISLRPKGQEEFGTKTELKNMNSFRGVEKALEHEILRQKDVLESGGTVLQETFLWDPRLNRTVAMRSKESAHDYRYFPEPDLVPLIVESAWIERIAKQLPELPHARRTRLVQQHGLSDEHAEVLIDSRAVADYFEQTVACGAEPRAAATWVMGEVLRVCKETKKEVGELATTPARLCAILGMVADGTLSASAAKRVFGGVEESGGEPREVVEKLGLKQISDSGALEAVVREILEASPDECRRYKDGEKKLMGFFVGQAMKRTKGKGNPKEINSIINRLLS
jgi:aspartyl-tRNA(Asn)/glutamyl-tRNA(Gln) amidotransferase subunit B